ncbi:quinone oxidoreductase family protein [Arsenicibacter rosenii]|uniref:Alcohol dehydrogenase n=1 Tax=Arsenicibacter rosenii TaxID=1750698 RepID=A0A1S2VEW3_9BACT|nr:zinc-binding dehydrogenase [Arsenicibacter rosenii]OIN56438.1 alcohol dehydrogenase [Arsenicibacter rosenii]
MKAIYLQDINKPLSFTEIDTPVPGPGEAVVAIRAAALNHRDVFIQQGLYPSIKLPVIPGSDGAGIVTAVGEGVADSWSGQEVLLNCGHNWGDNPAFYSNRFTILGMPDNGTFAEYVRIGAEYLHPKPSHLSFAEAAALPLAGLTAWRALMTQAGLAQSPNPANEKVLITGIGGGVALFALQFAVAAGAEVWVTSGSAEKLTKAIALGATGGVNYKDEDWHKSLLSQTGGGRQGYFSVIIDGAGGPSFSRLIDCAAPGGRIAVYGGTTGKITDLLPAKIFFKQLHITGSTMGTPDEFSAMLAFAEKYQIKPVIDQTFVLADAEKAYQRMTEGKQFGKLILQI